MGIDNNIPGAVRFVGDASLTFFSALLFARLVVLLVPEADIDVETFPWSTAYNLTEPLLNRTRQVVPPLSGVDSSPIFWLAITSFMKEIFFGPQGIFTLIEREGGIDVR